MNRPLNRDRLFMMPRDRAASLAHRVLIPLNRLEGEDLVAAVALLFAAVCTRTRIAPDEVHRMAMRMLRHEPHHDRANLQLEALRDFAGIQAAGDNNVSIM